MHNGYGELRRLLLITGTAGLVLLSEIKDIWNSEDSYFYITRVILKNNIAILEFFGDLQLFLWLF